MNNHQRRRRRAPFRYLLIGFLLLIWIFTFVLLNQLQSLSNAENEASLKWMSKQAKREPKKDVKGVPNELEYDVCHFGNETMRIPRIPQAIIIGAQKGGTTAIGYFLSQHPNVLATKMTLQENRSVEPHFFDWRMPLTDESFAKQLQHYGSFQEFVCHKRREYMEYFPEPTSDRFFAYEKTPAYFSKAKIIPANIRRVLPFARKMLLLVRNPVDRAYSQYLMELVVKQAKIEDFRRLLNLEFSYLNRSGLSRAPTMEVGFDEEQEIPAAPELSEEEELDKYFDAQEADSHLRRGMYSIPLKLWMKYFRYPDELLVINHDDFKTQGNETVYRRILNFFDLPYHEPVSGFIEQNTLFGYSPMKPKIRRYLERFYEPYNKELEKLLGPEWKDVWKPEKVPEKNNKKK